jgi:CDP-6-deoxy-D-xylo-4-hexulose-3-dehydrase
MKKNLDNILSDLTEYVKENKPKYLYGDKFIPGKSTVLYSGPYWDETEIMAGIKTFINGKWLVAGENVHKFEHNFSKRFNIKYSQMVNSGSSANLILIASLKKYYKWGDNDEIIVSPVGFATTISVLPQNKLKPVFVDIELNTLNFDITKIEEKITPKTRAIFISPVLGNLPDMDILTEIAKKHNLILIGDCCDSIGSKWKDINITTYFTAFSVSFYASHLLAVSEGGMVCTDIEDLKTLFTSFSSWGRACYCVGSANLLCAGSCGVRFSNWIPEYNGILDHRYIFSEMGFNTKPSLDMLGAIGNIQLTKIDEIIEKRKKHKIIIENILLRYVDNLKGVTTLSESDTCWFATPFICKDKVLKDKLVSFLEENKIQTRNYFAGNILLQPGYKHLGDYKEFTNSNTVLDTIFFIGCTPHYTQDVFDYVEEIFKTKWIN